MTVDPLLRLVEHMGWANERCEHAIATLAEDRRGEALRLYGHVLSAEEVWLRRVAGEPPGEGPWPRLDLPAAAELRGRTTAGWREVVDAGRLDQAVTYHTMAGDAFTSRILDIVLHVTTHGMYHRGQIAREIAREGGEPPGTGLIVFAREGR